MTSPLSPLAGEVLHRLASESLARMDAIRAANAGAVISGMNMIWHFGYALLYEVTAEKI